MLSKKILRLFFYLPVFLLLSGLVSCSYFFEVKEKEKVVNYNEKSTTCIGQVNGTLKDYFKIEEGVVEVSSEDLDAVTACYQESLSTIISHTKSGRVESNRYTPENFVLLVNKFHPEIVIEVEKILYYNQLKRFLFGGDAETISKSELQAIHDVLPAFVDLLKTMNPYRALLLGQENLNRNQEDYAKYDKVFKIFKAKLGVLLKKIEKYKGRRSLDVREFGGFLFSEYYTDEAEDHMKYLDLLISFKNLTLNKNGDLLESTDLSIFVIQMVRVYQAILRYENFVKDDSIFTSLGKLGTFIMKVPDQLKAGKIFKTVTLDALFDIVHTVESVFSYSANSKPGHRIPFVKVRMFLKDLSAAGFMGDGTLTPETLSIFMDRFSRSWLDPGSKSTPDITAQKAAYIREMIVRWYDKQKVINEIFENRESETVSFEEPLADKVKDKNFIQRWEKLFRRVSTHQWDAQRRLTLNRRMDDFTYEELTVSNSLETLADLFMKPFNLQVTDPFDYKITEEQTQAIYDVVRILGVELAFMDSRIFDSGRRGFREGNNFSTQKRNDEFMDFYEGYEYLSMAMSSGHLADEIYEGIDDHYHLDYNDVHHKPVTEAPYFRSYLKANFAKYFSHLKLVSRYWQESSDVRRDKFLGTLEIASRAGVITDKPYDLGEIRTLSTILNYLESIFHVFDFDSNGVAEKQELIGAELHFRSLVQTFLLSQDSMLKAKRNTFINHMKNDNPSLDPKSVTKEDIVRWLTPKVFIYLLDKGGIPGSSSVSFLWLLSKDGERKKYRKVKANAHDVLKVFSALAKITHKTHVEDIKNFLLDQHGYVQVGSLLKEIDSGVMPNCEPQSVEAAQSQFCVWARVLFCNETMNPELYEWMSNNRYNLFPEEDWKFDTSLSLQAARENYDHLHPRLRSSKKLKTSEDLLQEAGEAIFQTMKHFEFTFRTHKKFSTQCAFPYLDEEKGYVELGMEAVNSTINGDEEDMGWVDESKETLSKGVEAVGEAVDSGVDTISNTVESLKNYFGIGQGEQAAEEEIDSEGELQE